MRKLLAFLFPFIFYGGFVCLLLPQYSHPYLGTVEEGTLTKKAEEWKRGNDYYSINHFKFKYRDSYGIIRNSEDVEYNIFIRSELCHSGFYTIKNSWREKQLVNEGKVYSAGIPGLHFFFICLYGFFILFYSIGQLGNQIDCICSGDNYRCNRCKHNFGCPFRFTDKEDPLDLSRIKSFFGY